MHIIVGVLANLLSDFSSVIYTCMFTNWGVKRVLMLLADSCKYH